MVWYFGPVAFGAVTKFDPAWAGQWKPWAFVSNFSEVRDEKYMAIYVDGAELKRFNKLAGEFVARDSDFHIGGRAGQALAGVMDEFAIFSAASIEADIKKIMERGLARAALGEAVQPLGKRAATWGELKVSHAD